jgi:hypothetical protein
MEHSRPLSLTQLRTVDRRAYQALLAILDRLELDHVRDCHLMVSSKGIVEASVTKMGVYVLHDVPTTHWVLKKPVTWFTLRSYARYHEIDEASAYRRWHRGLIPGAFVARGQVSIPPEELTPAAKERFEANARRWIDGVSRPRLR